MKKAKNIVKSIGYLFVGMLVALCVYTFVMTDILKKDYANVFGYTYFVVATGSMSGTIEVNDVVIVKLTDDVELNDIITYQGENGEFITHRVVKKIGNQIITQGDVNNTEDEPISKEDIVGKVTMVISPSFVIKLIAVLLIVFILLAFLNFDKLFKKFVVGEEKPTTNTVKGGVPEELFSTTPVAKEEKSTGNTVNIPISEVLQIQKDQELAEVEDEIEVLEVEEERLEKKNKLSIDDFLNAKLGNNNKTTTVAYNQSNSTYHPSPIISPIYGIEEPVKKNTTLELENTANLQKFDDEIRKTNEFLNKLRELQEKLD